MSGNCDGGKGRWIVEIDTRILTKYLSNKLVVLTDRFMEFKIVVVKFIEDFGKERKRVKD